MPAPPVGRRGQKSLCSLGAHGRRHVFRRRLADGLAGIDGLRVDPVQTNMVFVDVPEEQMEGLVAHLKANDVLAAGYTGERMRLVTHLDVSTQDIDTAVAKFGEFFAV